MTKEKKTQTLEVGLSSRCSFFLFIYFSVFNVKSHHFRFQTNNLSIFFYKFLYQFKLIKVLRDGIKKIKIHSLRVFCFCFSLLTYLHFTTLPTTLQKERRLFSALTLFITLSLSLSFFQIDVSDFLFLSFWILFLHSLYLLVLPFF